MKKYDFNHGWLCRALKDGAEAVPVMLPHDAMRTEARIEGSLGEGNIGWFEANDYEYTKRFTLTEEQQHAAHLTLEFESVYRHAEVWLNGEKAAFRPYGYTNFYVDLKPFLKEGENEIRVIARNADQPNSRWYSGTGIFRPVWLWAYGDKHVLMNSVKIDTLDIRPAKIRVRAETSIPGDVRVEILDGEKCLAKTEGAGPFTIKLPEAELWCPENPKLYTCRVTFAGDVCEETFGIRTLGWSPEKGVTLNGERIVIRGACIHHDNGLLGAASYPEVEERRIRILQKAGYNAVRSAHNPCSKYQLEACDKLGMLMMDEYVDCWYMHKTQYDYATWVTDWWKQDLKDMVDKDYNHPCVIMYSTGNEVAETAQEKGIALQKGYTEYLHGLDPSRPVTCGINIFFNFLSSAGFGVYSDEKARQQAEAAKKAAENAQAKKPKKKAVGSEFYNLLAAAVGCDFMKFGATLPPCDWKTKDAFAAMDIAGYNYGNWRYRHDAKKYPHRLILGSETLIGDAYDFWEIAKDTPQVVGDFVWIAWDYIGECGAGDNGPEFDEYKTGRVFDCIRGGPGRVDVTGKLTPEADYTRICFELEKGPKLAVFPVNQAKKLNMTDWTMSRAQRSWSWQGCEGKDATVEVYARAASVELFVNGKSVGKKKPRKARAIFRTPYAPGELTAVSYDLGGREIGRDTLRTAGPELELRLEPESASCKPGEMVYFRMRYTDKNGEVKPLERHRIKVEAENGAVMGTANASVFFEGNYAQSEVPSYFGEAQTVVQAGEAGVLRVTVSDGERTVTAELPCKE